jgi:aconitate hydratase
MSNIPDPFQARDKFDTGSGQAGIYRLSRLEDAGLTKVARLPFSIRQEALRRRG